MCSMMAVSLAISQWNSVTADYTTAISCALMVWLLLLLTKSWLKACICFAFLVALCGRWHHCSFAACHKQVLTAQERGACIWLRVSQQHASSENLGHCRRAFRPACTGIARESSLALRTPLGNVAPQRKPPRQGRKKKGQTAILSNGLSQTRY